MPVLKMKAHELALQLLQLPDVEVKHLWDGRARTTINLVWVAKCGNIIVTADYDHPCYDEEERPKSAPTEEEEDVWYTEKAPEY